MHPWIGAGDEDCRRILDELGLDSIDRLFEDIPAEVRVDKLDMMTALDEVAIAREMGQLASANRPLGDRPSFLGAGVYHHVKPSVVNAVLSRAEFFTSYTPYQPEISQGTLQAIFEFQTMMAGLTNMDIANASLYDGATALSEAVLFCHRVLRSKRTRVVMVETIHPIYREVLGTYTRALGLEVIIVGQGEDGRVDIEALRAAAENACCVAVQSPNFLGIVEDLPAIAEVAHEAGALAVHVVAEAASLGLLSGGGKHGFDVVCGEAQSFGIPMGFGGPYLGFFSCDEKRVRQMPGRLVGQTVDEKGDRAFCLTLATREQHIRRAKATSNICTNQGLMALAATIWLETVGGSGLKELALSCFSRTREIMRRIDDLDGPWRLAFPDTPIFNEFLLLGPGSGEDLVKRIGNEGVIAGLPSRKFGGGWPDGVIVAATEMTTKEHVDQLISALLVTT